MDRAIAWALLYGWVAWMCLGLWFVASAIWAARLHTSYPRKQIHTTWVFAIVAWAFVAFALIPGQASRGSYYNVHCLSSLKQIGMAQSAYQTDNDQTFPPAAAWYDSLAKYRRDDLGCPLADDRYGLAMNGALDKVRFTSIESPEIILSGVDTNVQGRNAVATSDMDIARRHRNIPVLKADTSVFTVGESALQTRKGMWAPGRPVNLAPALANPPRSKKIAEIEERRWLGYLLLYAQAVTAATFLVAWFALHFAKDWEWKHLGRIFFYGFVILIALSVLWPIYAE